MIKSSRRSQARTRIRKRSKRSLRENRKWQNVTSWRKKRHGGKCEVCRDREAVHGHHVQPRSRGGESTYDNCRAVCAECHSRIHENPSWAVANGWTIVADRHIGTTPAKFQGLGTGAMT